MVLSETDNLLNHIPVLVCVHLVGRRLFAGLCAELIFSHDSMLSLASITSFCFRHVLYAQYVLHVCRHLRQMPALMVRLVRWGLIWCVYHRLTLCCWHQPLTNSSSTYFRMLVSLFSATVSLHSLSANLSFNTIFSHRVRIRIALCLCKHLHVAKLVQAST
jgi:hypothetical protein